MSESATTTEVPLKKFNFKRVNPAAAATPAPAATPAAIANIQAQLPAPVTPVAEKVFVAADPTPPTPPIPASVAGLAPTESAEMKALRAQLAALQAAQATPAPAVIAPAPTVAVAVVTPPQFKTPAINSPAVQPAAGAVTEYRAAPSYGDDSDTIGVEDINLPRLNIVQKVGNLSNIFTPGDVVFGKELVLRDAPKFGEADNALPLRIVICGLRADRWVEKTKGGDMGDIVDTEAEVFAKGHTTDYNENQANPAKKYYQQLAEALVLIEKPEHVDDPRFSYAANGKFWSPALWAMKGTAFTNGAKVFRTARKAGWLKDDVDLTTGQITKARGYIAGIWELRTFMKEFKGNWAAVPALKRGDYSPADVQALAIKVLG